MYDVIIVGARCAGSPTAMLLARKGYRVLLVEKATFPCDTMSGQFIHERGVACLKRWGILDQLIATNCPAITRKTIDLGPFSLTGSILPIDGVAACYAPRRFVLDQILADAAVEAGAEFHDGFNVQEILMEGGRVTGIRGRHLQGEPVTEKAILVIGADGMRSLVARAVQAPTYQNRPDFGCGYYAYWSGVPIEGVEIYPRDHRIIFAIPTNDGKTLVAVQWRHEEFHTVRRDIPGHFMQTLDEFTPHLARRVREGKQEERFTGTGDLPNFFRKPYGPGWALVGDAGHFQDPILAQGISDAFHDAELLAEAVDSGLSGRRPLKEALADYEQRRNEVALPLYELNCQMATLEPPPPEMQALFNALRGNQVETDRYIATMGGTISPAEFFAPENIARIMSGSSQ
ncbi:MAG: NAD(P)/FAD-dependent oxidoreductase [Chloroflexi bacterium]|nr:NAD(P)/FAD-dependent oxidoreductase [Chloroflexota bacterium]